MENINEYDENISMLHAQGTTITLFTYQIPAKMKLKITDFSNYLDLQGHWGHVTWSIRRNGIGVRPYNAILDQLGLSNRPRKITPPTFEGSDTLTIIAVDDNTIAQPPLLNTGIALRYELIG